MKSQTFIGVNNISPLKLKSARSLKAGFLIPGELSQIDKPVKQINERDQDEKSHKLDGKSLKKSTSVASQKIIFNDECLNEEKNIRQIQVISDSIVDMEKKLNEVGINTDIDLEAIEYRTKGGSKQVLDELDAWKNLVEHQKRRQNTHSSTSMKDASSPRLQQLKIIRKGSLLNSQFPNQSSFVPETVEKKTSGGDSTFRIRHQRNGRQESKESLMEKTPQINEFMLNNILTEEFIEEKEDFQEEIKEQVNKQNRTQSKNTRFSSEIQLTSGQNSLFASPNTSINQFKSSSLPSQQQSPAQSPIKTNLKQVTFKSEEEEQSFNLEQSQLQEDNQFPTQQDSLGGKPQKKYLKQKQQEANADLIEKLFLIKLRKRMQQVAPPSEEDHYQRENKDGLITSNSEINEFAIERASNKKKERLEFVNNQQNIVKEEIELFQKRTLQSFKFIQEIKKTRIGTPKLLGLVNGNSGGMINSEWKAELYSQQLKQEYALESNKKSQKLEQELNELGKQPDKLEEVHNKLFQKYAVALELARTKKEEIEEKRLLCCQMTNLIKSKSEEIDLLFKNMNKHLDTPSLTVIVEQPKSPLKPNKFAARQSKAPSLRQKQPSESEGDKAKRFEVENNKIQMHKNQIKQNYYKKHTELAQEILELKTNFTAMTHELDKKQYELQDIKHSKALSKKALKDFYLSLLQFDKTSTQPLISITKLIAYMQGIGEEINEKMLPEYFDKESIQLVRKIQILYQQIDKLDDQLNVAQRGIKSKITSQMNSMVQDPKQEVEIKNVKGGDEQYKQLMKMLLGNEVDHLGEIKTQLRIISKNTSQRDSPSKFYQQQQEFIEQQQSNFSNPLYRRQSQLEQKLQSQDSSALIHFQSPHSHKQSSLNESNIPILGHGNSISITTSNQNTKKNDENYLLLKPLKKGSLSVLSDQKYLIDKLQGLQQQVQELKEQELERQIKLYFNVTSEEKIQNVQKLFTFMYGISEGNFWFSKFIVKRKEIQIKSQSTKTFTFAQVMFSKHAQQEQLENNNNNNTDRQTISQKSSRENSLNSSKLISSNNASRLNSRQSSSLIHHQAQIRTNFYKLQSTSNLPEFPAFQYGDNNSKQQQFLQQQSPIPDSFALFTSVNNQKQKILREPITSSQNQQSTQNILQSLASLETFTKNTITPNKSSRNVHFPSKYFSSPTSALFEQQQLQQQGQPKIGGIPHAQNKI